MKIKVCGLREAENFSAVAGLNPDYMGFIFYELSSRYAADLSTEDLEKVPSSIIKTAVFVNESLEKVKEIIKTYIFDAVQLHGNENPEFCAALKGGVVVIKAFGIDEDFDFEKLKPFEGVVDYFLFDTKTPKHGGSGLTFNWAILDKYKLNIPFFLSGGLGPENIADVKHINHLQFYGVDLNSKFEIVPGLKDINKLKTAFDAIKQLNTNEVRS